MQKLGQHFLKDRSAAEKIVRSLALEVGETIVEIGPGHGELTVLLAEACASHKCHLIAIEKDVHLSAELRKRMVYSSSGNPEVVDGDALTTLPLLVKKFNGKPYKLVGNLPYYITGFLLRVIQSLPEKPVLSVFMMQKEVAERILALPPHGNKLSASVRFWAEPFLITTLTPRSFKPPPRVDSAVLKLTTKPQTTESPNEKKYYETLTIIFKQPRKTVMNNLLAGSPRYTKHDIETLLRSLAIPPDARPQNLTIEHIQKLAERLR